MSVLYSLAPALTPPIAFPAHPAYAIEPEFLVREGDAEEEDVLREGFHSDENQEETGNEQETEKLFDDSQSFQDNYSNALYCSMDMMKRYQVLLCWVQYLRKAGMSHDFSTVRHYPDSSPLYSSITTNFATINNTCVTYIEEQIIPLESLWRKWARMTERITSSNSRVIWEQKHSYQHRADNYAEKLPEDKEISTVHEFLRSTVKCSPSTVSSSTTTSTSTSNEGATEDDQLRSKIKNAMDDLRLREDQMQLLMTVELLTRKVSQGDDSNDENSVFFEVVNGNDSDREESQKERKKRRRKGKGKKAADEDIKSISGLKSRLEDCVDRLIMDLAIRGSFNLESDSAGNKSHSPYDRVQQFWIDAVETNYGDVEQNNEALNLCRDKLFPQGLPSLNSNQTSPDMSNQKKMDNLEKVGRSPNLLKLARAVSSSASHNIAIPNSPTMALLGGNKQSTFSRSVSNRSLFSSKGRKLQITMNRKPVPAIRGTSRIHKSTAASLSHGTFPIGANRKQSSIIGSKSENHSEKTTPVKMRSTVLVPATPDERPVR